MSDLDKAIRAAADEANWFGLHNALTAVLNELNGWDRDAPVFADRLRRVIAEPLGVSDRSEPTPAPREYRAGDTEPPVGTKLTGGGFTWTRHGRSWQTPEGGVLNWAQLTEFCPRLSEVVAPAPREPRQFDRDEPSGVIKVRDRLGRVWNRNDRNGFWYEHGCAPQTWPELWSQLRPLSEVVSPEGTS